MSEKPVGLVQHGNDAHKQRKPNVAYISAPPGIDTRSIRRALEAKGVQSFSPDQLDTPGLLSDVLREGMRRADFIVAVTDPSPASNLVFFEVGYGQGMGKPVFVFLADDASPSVWMANGTPYFRFDPENVSALNFAVQQILAIPRNGALPPPTPAKQTQPIGAQADELLALLRGAGNGSRESVLEDVIGRAIRLSGVTSVEQGGEGGRYVDFVVWSEDLSPWVGNPLAIELRQIVRSSADVNMAVGKLTQAMARGGMPWGLFIHGPTPLDVWNAIASPNILSISAEDFVESLRTTSFGKLVRELRNKRVHGGS